MSDSPGHSSQETYREVSSRTPSPRSEVEDRTSSVTLPESSPEVERRRDLTKRLRECFGDTSDSSGETKAKKKTYRKTPRKASRLAGREPEFQGLDYTGKRAILLGPNTSRVEAQTFEGFEIQQIARQLGEAVKKHTSGISKEVWQHMTYRRKP